MIYNIIYFINYFYSNNVSLRHNLAQILSIRSSASYDLADETFEILMSELA
jgi:hypothetical protein